MNPRVSIQYCTYTEIHVPSMTYICTLAKGKETINKQTQQTRVSIQYCTYTEIHVPSMTYICTLAKAKETINKQTQQTSSLENS